MRRTWLGATSGRSWMTTAPPFESWMFSRLAGSAAISGGAIRLATGAAAGGGAGLAAIKASATKGNAISDLDMRYSRPNGAEPLSAAWRASLARKLRLDVGGDCGGHELGDVAAVAGDFLDQPRSNRLQGDVGHQEDGFDVVVQLLVHARHLKFIFEIGDGAQAAQDQAGALRFGEVHQQGIELDDVDIGGDADDLPPDHGEPFGDREH